MIVLRRIFGFIGIGLLALTLTACAATYRNHGYVPDQKDLDEIAVGLDTRETVAGLIGRPGTSGLLTGSAWYYVRSRFEDRTYHAPREIERQVVSISFDENGVVENIERFGLEDGKVIVLNRRVTDSNIKGISFIRQLFGSFGRIDVSQLL